MATSKEGPASAGIKSFPLPQELKDWIYSYLLHADYVKVDRDEGVAQAYKFKTNLLRVNKTIGAEAKAYLYKNNQLVKVKYRMPGLLKELHTTGIHHTRLDSDRASSLIDHCLDLDIVWEQPLLASETGASLVDGLGVLMMLLPDLLRLFKGLGLRSQSAQTTGTYIVSNRGQHLQLWTCTDQPARSVTIIARSASLLASSAQIAILDSMRNMIGNTVSVVNFEQQDTVALLKRDLKPSLAWSEALSWNLYDAALTYKLQADDWLRSDKPAALRSALCLYTHLFSLMYDVKTPGISLSLAATQPELPSTIDHYKCFEADLLGCGVLCLIRMREYSVAADMLQVMSKYYEVASLELVKKIWHIGIFFTLFGAIDHGAGIARKDLQGALDTIAATPEIMLSPNVEYDRVQISEALKEKGAYIMFDPACTSIHALPAEPFDHHREFPLPDRPASLVGCQDVSHLASLTLAEREGIVKTQKEMGLPVTDFK